MQPASSRQQPLLAGVRVLDLTNVLAGPFCGYQLALIGADVIKIEAPGGGDLARQLGSDPSLNSQRMGASFLAQNAQKRSVVLDLKSQEGKDDFLRLVGTADVVLENFRPGVMDRLELGYEKLRKIKPGLVYCAISGFGQTGPLAGFPAYDQIIQGLSGLMSVTGDASSGPLRVGSPVCDTIGGMNAAFAICAALLRQSRTGEGAFLDVSMLDSTLSSMGWIVSNLLIAKQEPVRMGNDNFTASPSGAFAARDALINIAANKQEQFVALCDIIGAPQLAIDSRFADREDRKRNRDELRSAIEQQLASDSAQNWADKMNQRGIPAGVVLSVPESLQQPQVVHRQFLTTLPLPLADHPTVTLARGGFMVDGESPLPTRSPPSLGEHTDEVLSPLRASIPDLPENSLT
ncbi:MAG: CaiB/BaiF CoA transferase family protein [Pigmentiphaga sp.]